MSGGALGDDIITQLEAATAAVRQRVGEGSFTLGVIAGSGLGSLGDLVEDAVAIPYSDIPHMPVPKVVGHAGKLVCGTLEGEPIAVLSGRSHFYEGYPMSQCVFGARLLGRLGVPGVLLTNAAGGIPPWFAPGTLCRIVDHLNLMGDNPLKGPNIEALGPRFPDMSKVYCPQWGGLLDAAASAAGVALEHGVYAALSGPSYETPAEIRMLRTLGAHCVGMSTVPEAIALRHMGVRVAGISVVTNHAAGVVERLLDHSEVKDVATEVGPRLLRIVRGFVRSLVSSGAKGGGKHC